MIENADDARGARMYRFGAGDTGARGRSTGETGWTSWFLRSHSSVSVTRFGSWSTFTRFGAGPAAETGAGFTRVYSNGGVARRLMVARSAWNGAQPACGGGP